MSVESTIAILPDEEMLAVRAAAEPAAFAALYDGYFPRVYNYVRCRVADRPAAEDLVALIFERALTHIGRYDPRRAPFGAWLMAIARNAVNDHLRAQRRRRFLSLDWLDEHPDDAPAPDEEALDCGELDRLHAALARLGERERDILALRFAAGLTSLRIAALTGLSEGHVRVIVYRAVERLRALIGAEEQSHG